MSSDVLYLISYAVVGLIQEIADLSTFINVLLNFLFFFRSCLTSSFKALISYSKCSKACPPDVDEGCDGGGADDVEGRWMGGTLG